MFCAYCGKEILNQSVFCRHCNMPTGVHIQVPAEQHPIKNKRSRFKTFLIVISANVIGIFFLFIIVAAIGGAFSDKTTTTDSTYSQDNNDTYYNNSYDSGETYPEYTTENPNIVISAQKLIDAYNNNTIKADSLYKGKELELTGTVSSIDKTLGLVYVSLRGSDEFSLDDITCYMDSSETNKVADINKGDKITIIGKCDGMVVILITLHGCTIK